MAKFKVGDKIKLKTGAYSLNKNHWNGDFTQFVGKTTYIIKVFIESDGDIYTNNGYAFYRLNISYEWGWFSGEWLEKMGVR